MRRAYSVSNVLTSRFRLLALDEPWRSAVGSPELTGTWMIYGAPKNGKTSFAMMLARCLAKFGRVAYNTVEEGLSQTIKAAVERAGLEDVQGRFILLDKESVEDMKERLGKHKSPDIVFIDSAQFIDMKFSEYKELKALFPRKLFIYVSHINGGQPDGQVAKRIWRDCNVYFRIEGFRAFPVSRYGGGKSIDVCEERAAEYWGLES